MQRIYLLTHDNLVHTRMQQHFADLIQAGKLQLQLIQHASVLLAMPDLTKNAVAWIDADTPGLPIASDPIWQTVTRQIPWLIASAHPSDEDGLMWLSHGARGYLNLYCAPQTAQHALAAIAEGQCWVGPSIMAKLLQRDFKQLQTQSAETTAHNSEMDLLSTREQEVAKLVALGRANKEIAQVLKITERTVKAHIATIFMKLGVNDRLQLALVVHGLVHKQPA